MKKVLIVDDEPAARAQLRDVIDSMPELVVVKEVSSGRAAIDAITDLAPDIVFLDIDMPQMDGFSVAKATEHMSYQLVFVTAHHQYALKAFETHAIDYLLKPARPSVIEKCLAKILRQETLTLQSHPGLPASSSLVLTDKSVSRVVNINQILYIEGLGRYRRIHLTADGSRVHNLGTVLSDTTLDEFTDQLCERGFLRIHRSHLINLLFVTSLKATGRQYNVFLDGVTNPIPVARSKVKILRTKLDTIR